MNTPPTTIRATRTPRALAGESAQHPDAILSKERGRTRQIEASSTPANVSRIHPWSAAARTCSTQPSMCAAIRRNGRRSFTESRRRDVSRRSHRVDGIIYHSGARAAMCCAAWRACRRDPRRPAAGGTSRAWVCGTQVRLSVRRCSGRAARVAVRHKLHHDDGRAQPQLAQGSLNTYEGAGGWRRESSNAKMTTGGATRARAWGVRVCVAPCTSQTAEIGY